MFICNYYIHVSSSAMTTAGFYLGMFIGPTTAGFLVDNYGFQFTCLIYCIFFTAGLSLDFAGMAFGNVK